MWNLGGFTILDWKILTEKLRSKSKILGCIRDRIQIMVLTICTSDLKKTVGFLYSRRTGQTSHKVKATLTGSAAKLKQ